MSAPKYDGFRPGPYVVFIHVQPHKSRSRLGGFDSEEQARAAIQRNEASRRDTLGGLFEPSKAKVEYSIWRAASWELVE